MKLYKDKGWLYKKYWEEKLSLLETANLCDVRIHNMRRWV